MKYTILIASINFVISHHNHCTQKPCKDVKKVCILDNVNCVTRGGFNIFKNAVNGIEGLVEPLDPLHIEEIEEESKNVKYNLIDITIRGLKHCTVKKLDLNVTLSKYDQFLYCPKLVIHFCFETEVNTDNLVLRGKGMVTMFAYDYDILNYGIYSVFVNEDHRPHFFIVTHESVLKHKGKLTFSLTDAMLPPNQTKVIDTNQVNTTVQYMNDCWRQTKDFLLKPIIKKAMKILINNIDVLIREYTMGEVLPFCTT